MTFLIHGHMKAVRTMFQTGLKILGQINTKLQKIEIIARSYCSNYQLVLSIRMKC